LLPEVSAEGSAAIVSVFYCHEANITTYF